MSAKIIDGKAIAADLRAKVAAETRRLTAAHGLTPGLAVVLVGDNAASKTYVASKARALIEGVTDEGGDVSGLRIITEPAF